MPANPANLSNYLMPSIACTDPFLLCPAFMCPILGYLATWLLFHLMARWFVTTLSALWLYTN